MATGRVVTLYEDKEKTQGIFPRTKISAISDDEGTGLDAIISELQNVDTELSTTSTNPVQNKVVAAAIGDISTALNSILGV